MRTYIAIPAKTTKLKKDYRKKLIDHYVKGFQIRFPWQRKHDQSCDENDIYTYVAVEICIPEDRFNDHLRVTHLSDCDVEKFNVIITNIDDFFEVVDSYCNAKKFNLL